MSHDLIPTGGDNDKEITVEPMHVRNDVNFGTIVPVFLFLLAQSMAGIWWAATLSSEVRAMKETITALPVALNNYYTKDQVDAKIVVLEARVEANETWNQNQSVRLRNVEAALRITPSEVVEP